MEHYFLKYNCIHGGKNFKPAGRGERSSSTFQKVCPATFHVNVSDDGKRLFISRMDLHHDHLTTKQLYEHLPQTRRMTPEVKEKVKELINLKANKTAIKDLIIKQTGKVVLLKDIYNLKYTGEKKNQLEAVKNILINDYQADCNFLIEDNIFKGLFFVTPQIKSAMEFYPEYVGIDATYKLLNIRAPVYLYIVKDPNGCT